MAQKQSILSWSEIAKKYPTDKFIHVLPAEDMLIAHDSPMWRLDVTIVSVDPHAKNDAYAIDKREATAEDAAAGRCKAVQNGQWTNYEPRYIGDTYGLAKAALERLAAAADVSILPLPVAQSPDGSRIEFSFVAGIRQRGGALRTVSASRVWDRELERDKCMHAAKKWAESAIAWDRKAKANQKGRELNIPGVGYKRASQCTPEEVEAAIRDRFETEWLREREFGPSKIESKAANRARRAIMGMPAAFSYEELRDKKFVVARWVFEPDCSDPAIKMLVVQNGLQAQGRAFALPAPQEQALALPPASVVSAAERYEPTAKERDAEDAEDGEFAETDAGTVDTTTGELLDRNGEDAAINEDLLRQKIAEAKAIRWVENIRKKHAAIADNDGWLPEFNAACDARNAELAGDPPPRTAPPADLAGSVSNEPDDVDALPDDELDFYIDAALPRYTGPRAADLKASVAKAKAAGDHKKLRVLLRAIYQHTGDQK